MARQERPVDPADGPLPALAHELRKLRVEAGSPTYRSLARRTGYSASTLSEAASGHRKPTLDVLLAYVGALNGDPEEWRRRWEAVGAPQAEKATETGTGTATGTAKASRTWAAAIGLVAVLVITAVAWKLSRHRPSATPAAAATPACPSPAAGAVFYARTYGSGTTIRQGPARVERPIAGVPAGCTIGLTGYCAGEPIIDSTAYTPDVRWFMVAGGGVLASATVHGNPPPGMALGHCPGEWALPTTIRLHMTATTLTAEGRNVQVVGYAAYHDGAWHQIGLTGPGSGDFAVDWRPVTGTVAAAACLGGEGSIGVTDLRAYPTGGRSRLPEAQRKTAGQVACLYPTAK